MKIRKILTITSAMMILCTTFSGCGSNNDDNDGDLKNKNIFGFGGHEASSSKEIKNSNKKNATSKKETENIPEVPEEISEMEMYNTAMQLYDTWLMGRLEGDLEKAKSVLSPLNGYLEYYDEDCLLNEYYNDYQIVQFLVTDITEKITKHRKANEDDYEGIPAITRGWQLNSQLMLFSPDGSYEDDTCTDAILEIDGKLYFCPDYGNYCDIEPERIGFSYHDLYPDVDYHGSSSHYDESTGEYIDEDYVVLTDGTKISEEEYDDSLVYVYGYCVEKKPDGTFSFHPVSVNGKVIFDDGSTAVVNGARWAEEEE